MMVVAVFLIHRLTTVNGDKGILDMWQILHGFCQDNSYNSSQERNYSVNVFACFLMWR